MATFSERNYQRLTRDVTTNIKECEIDQLIADLQKCRKRNNNECVFLRIIPPEVRNMIYEYVADDFHSKYHKSDEAIPAKSSRDTTRYTRHQAGRLGVIPNIPGLLGTCRQIFLEFHSIFYSSAYWNVWVCKGNREWDRVQSPALTDIIVNTKHAVIGYSTDTKRQWEEKYAEKLANRSLCRFVVYPMDAERYAADEGVGYVVLTRRPPFGNFEPSPNMPTDCRNFVGARASTRVEAECGMCLIHRHDKEKNAKGFD